ncbi:MAG: O-methyltransferase [Bacillota bacterium]|nr:O-methyltransferase [Bacillota bacterium]
MINSEEMIQYLRALIPESQGILKELEEEAERDKVPIIQPEVAQLLETLIMTHQSKKVLEIGTAIGYSTIRFAGAVAPFDGQVVTIELQDRMRQRALKNISRAGYDQFVTSFLGDAREVIPLELAHLKANFDFIFIDAAKGQYVEFFKLCLPLLAPGGLLVADNVLYKGWVVPDAIFPRRQKTLITRLRTLLRELFNREDFKSTLLPMGDGVLVSYYKEVKSK